jgi:hypothetical protein
MRLVLEVRTDKNWEILLAIKLGSDCGLRMRSRQLNTEALWLNL